MSVYQHRINAYLHTINAYLHTIIDYLHTISTHLNRIYGCLNIIIVFKYTISWFQHMNLRVWDVKVVFIMKNCGFKMKVMLFWQEYFAFYRKYCDGNDAKTGEDMKWGVFVFALVMAGNILSAPPVEEAEYIWSKPENGVDGGAER